MSGCGDGKEQGGGPARDALNKNTDFRGWRNTPGPFRVREQVGKEGLMVQKFALYTMVRSVDIETFQHSQGPEASGEGRGRGRTGEKCI